MASAAFIGSRFGRTESSPTPLPIPKLIDAAKHGHAVKLKVASGRHAFVRGKPAATYGYSRPVLGPVIRVRRGDEVEMTVVNALGCDTTVHWHGVLLPGDVGGGPQQAIKPGGTWRPILKIDQPASTTWYHPHPHHDTARQLYMGLTGIIIIDDSPSSDLDLPRTYGVDDLPIVLQDRSFAPDGSLEYSPSPMAAAYGSRGDTIVANGAVAPLAKVPRGLVRLRLLDGANARNFDLRFSDNRTFHVIASDAGFLAAPVAVSQLTISPAERFEILVDFMDGKAVTLQTGPDTEIGLFGALTEHHADGEYEPVVHFETSAIPAAVKTLPTRLVEPPEADPSGTAGRRQFILDSGMEAGSGRCGPGGRQMGINGKPHDLERIDAVAALSDVDAAWSGGVGAASARQGGRKPAMLRTTWRGARGFRNKATEQQQ